MNLVRTDAAAVLGHSSVDAARSGHAFQELGLDLSNAWEPRNRLNTAMGLRLPATLEFSYPAPAVLADFLKREIGYENANSRTVVFGELGKIGIAPGCDARTDLADRVRARLLTVETEHDVTANDNDLEAAAVDNIFDLLDGELAD